MKKGGFLLYKCRLCGSTERNPHVPDVLFAIGAATMNDWTVYERMFPLGGKVRMTDVHSCSDGRTGVTDLIGGEHDPD